MNYFVIFVLLVFAIFTSCYQFSFGQTYDENRLNVQTIAKNLKIPWELVFTPDGRMFVTERTGAIRIIQNDTLLEKPLKTFEVSGGEGGLLGIALDPKFSENHYLYVYYTYNNFLFTYNKVVRFTESNNELIDEKTILDNIPGGLIHDGGRIKFGPDGALYVLTGESGQPELAQDLNSLGGKILRINSDGTIPQDNPFSNSPVFSYGHRNPQGLDWDLITGKLVIAEHGPSGEKGFAHDEINIVEPGKNYGWPKITGSQTDYVSPLLQTGDATWAPSGLVFYTGDKIPAWKNKFLVATLRGNHLRVLDLNLQENRVTSNTSVFLGEFGRLRDVTMSPTGDLYMLTSNQDGRGNPTIDDDRILKIIPISTALSPLKQIESGIIPSDVKCNEHLELVIKSSNGISVCVKPNTKQKLIERGWATYT